MTEGVTQSRSLKMTVEAEDFKNDSWHSAPVCRAEMSNLFSDRNFAGLVP